MNYLNQLSKSRNTIIEMIELRGYNLDKYKNFSDKELDIMDSNMGKKNVAEIMPLDMVSEHKDGNKKCLVKYIIGKLRGKVLKTLIDELLEYEKIKEGDDVIIIVKDKINNLDAFYILFDTIFKSSKLFVQLFSMDHLLVNIKNHVLVPELHIVSEKDKNEIKEQYNVESMTQFPLILKSDPMAKFYGVKNGDLCKIIRQSETSGQYISYRYCE